MKERYFITGGSGFVGSNVVHALVGRGDHVAILIRSGRSNRRLADLGNHVVFYKGDITRSNIKAIFAKEKPTVVFHFATYGTLPWESDFNRMLDVNVIGLHRLLSAANNSSVRLFIHSGSSSEYGVQDAPMRESDVPRPVNDYGLSKTAATLLCQKMSLHATYTTVIFRLFSPYGYRDNPKRFIPMVITAARTGRPINATKRSFVRDFIFIDDVVRAYEQAVKRKGPALQGQIINIGSGQQHTLADVVTYARQITKKSIMVSWNTKQKQDRQLEPSMWQADIAKAGRLLRWKPTVTLATGLEKLIQGGI